ncbi:DNA ligase [Salmonella phage 19]|nr:DNA ligase [Salmonella phage 19]
MQGFEEVRLSGDTSDGIYEFGSQDRSSDLQKSDAVLAGWGLRRSLDSVDDQNRGGCSAFVMKMTDVYFTVEDVMGDS